MNNCTYATPYISIKEELPGPQHGNAYGQVIAVIGGGELAMHWEFVREKAAEIEKWRPLHIQEGLPVEGKGIEG
jgi:hypothetical protein